MTAEVTYREVNRAGWRYLAEHGSDSSQPYLGDKLDHALEWLDPHDWLPWDRISSVLCLGSGGGQQGPMYASLGCRTTVVDLCAEQLDLDRASAAKAGLEIECIEADIQDLGVLRGRQFDLVHQPVSTCYVPDVTAVYAQVRPLLADGGLYDVEHWNPVHTQLVGYGAWVDEAYVIEHPQVPGQPLAWHMSEASTEVSEVSCWHYVHRLEDLVGGACRAGFRVVRVAERPDREPDQTPGSPGHLSAYAPSFLRLLCRADAPSVAQ
ncbi:MAG: class I SAM-dependent methyltransferase [Actinomycetota bacterium]|nr:class I SAM-dependent methyltransferase [Actinomycetota bacterium]